MSLRRRLAHTLAAAALLAPAASAQQDTTARLNFIFVLTPKPGMAKQLEDGFKKHIAWHSQQRDQRAIAVSTVAVGDGVGQYRVVYRNLRWEDQDRAAPTAAADIADVNVNLAPYLESTVSLVSVRRDDLSRIPATEPARAMSWVTYVYVKPGKATEYANYLARLKEAHDGANSSYRYFVLQVIIGGNTPAFAIVRPGDKWTDFPPPQNRAVLVRAYGEYEADRLLNVMDDVVRRTASFVSMQRPDLSYTPASR